jgi:hypothetical protein
MDLRLTNAAISIKDFIKSRKEHLRLRMLSILEAGGKEGPVIELSSF